MKKLIIAILLLTTIKSLYAQDAHQKYTQKSPNKIVVTATVGQTLLTEVQQGKAYLVDVRTAEEYNAGHLQYAKNADIKTAGFGTLISKLDKSKPVYLYCHSGNRAGKATDSLLVLGFNKPYNIGGLDSLKKAGFPASK